MPPISGKRAASSPLNSEFDKRPKLGLSDGKLKALNEDLEEQFEEVISISSPEHVESKHLVRAFREVARQIPNIDETWTNRSACKELVERLSPDERLRVASLWIDARNERDWSEFANYLVQQVGSRTQELVEDPSQILPDEKSEQATIKSWDIAYVGNAHDLLYQHIVHYSAANFVKYTSIVQSSGMGKSRTIDEFSKKHLVVPVNIRDNLTGFPPADVGVRKWLLGSTTKNEAFNRAVAYLCALFSTLRSHLRQIDDKLDAIGISSDANLATKFRLLMTAGQTFSQQGAARTQFYDDVLELADKRLSVLRSATPASPTLSPATINVATENESNLQQALEPLMEFLIRDYDPGTCGPPVLILSFDEAHPLAEVQTNSPGPWSRFSQLKRALRIIQRFPCFSLFLSTTGKVNQFMPQPHDDSTRYLKLPGGITPPFCELGFDQLAEKVILNETTIDDLASPKFMATLCRPLFAGRYLKGDADVRSLIVEFAGEKLLCKPFPLDDQAVNGLTGLEKLACISVRIPLEFGFRYSHASQEMEQTLVEKHLRVCLQVNPRLETPITVAASEPLLAEASCRIMSMPSFKLPHTLLNALEHQGLDKGNRGELIAMVLCLLARDAAKNKSRNRVTPVCDFIRELLASSSVVLESMPTRARSSEEANKTFQETFGNSKIYFDHFVKLHDNEIINRKFLWVLIARGAAGICVHYQVGIDIVIPFLFWDPVLRQKNVSAIFIQCKNDATFQATPREYLFDMMNPYHIEFFDNKESPLPVIRMVFALASPISCMVMLSGPKRPQPPRSGAYKANFQLDNYTAFDIWCAGASSETFRPITINDGSTFNQLLQRSRQFPDVFDKKMSEGLRNVTRSMDPASGSHRAHYHNYTLF